MKILRQKHLTVYHIGDLLMMLLLFSWYIICYHERQPIKTVDLVCCYLVFNKISKWFAAKMSAWQFMYNFNQKQNSK